MFCLIPSGKRCITLLDMYKSDKIKDLHAFFLKELKPRKPVILRFSNKMKLRGAYSYYNNKHFITLNNKDNLFTLYDSYIHEMAHCLQKGKFGKEEHSNEWGNCFSRCYRCYLKWLEE